MLDRETLCTAFDSLGRDLARRFAAVLAGDRT